jgi:hypothetical protein
MSNSWKIPLWLEKEIIERDKVCVYCGVQMVDKIPPKGSRKTVATWEHIVNDATIINRENIARCCAACNSSKGTKNIVTWLQTRYCQEKGITESTVAEVIKAAIKISIHQISNH